MHEVHDANGKPVALVLDPDEKAPFRPSPHSLALRQGIARGLQVAQFAQRAKMMPRDAQMGAILECMTHLILMQVHLCDAVLGLQGEPREVRFQAEPPVSLVSES